MSEEATNWKVKCPKCAWSGMRSDCVNDADSFDAHCPLCLAEVDAENKNYGYDGQEMSRNE